MSVPYAEVIGKPVRHSLSPLIHEHWLREVGIGGRFAAKEVSPSTLAEYLQARRSDPNWRGCSVTLPLKEQVVPLLDTLSADAAEIGAVNCICRSGNELHGRNTDVAGIAAALENVKIVDEAAAVIGGGGAARAALRYLVSAGCSSIRLIVRDPAKAEPLRGLVRGRLRILSFSDADEALRGVKLVVNASPLGMERSASMPPDILDRCAKLGAGTTLFDMVYRPFETALLSAARSGGAQAVGGLPMLIGQARAAFELFYGAPAPEGREALPAALVDSLQPADLALRSAS
jgi:shikimate dehydrogenase